MHEKDINCYKMSKNCWIAMRTLEMGKGIKWSEKMADECAGFRQRKSANI